MNKVIDVVGISGGKDSTATALLAIENLEDPPRFVFCDTGIEAPATYEYIEYLSEKLKVMTGAGVEVIKADFTEQMAKKKAKLALKGEPNRRIDAMEPTGNPFLDLCVWKGRFPSSRCRFCTEHLKMNPTIKFIQSLMQDGDTVMSWSGERAEESLARAKKPVKEVLLKTENAVAYTYRPILRWTEQMCFDKLKQHGIEPNPLYAQGFNRVGCFPCVMCRKAEIKQIADLYPEVFDRLKEWEKAVAQTNKNAAASFFSWEGDRKTIDDYIAWSRTPFRQRRDKK